MAHVTDMDYVLGRSDREHDRLRHQARFWEPETSGLLDRVGIPRGARCLDVGCGPGETMRLLAERVGPEGHVTGIDVDEALGARAILDLHAAGHRQCGFAAADAGRDEGWPDGRFDVVYARMLLLHVDDPPKVLRRLWDRVAVGGHLVVQDYDLLTSEVVPPLPTVDEFREIALGTFHRAGRDPRVGLGLPALHVAAGIGPPDGIEAGARVADIAVLAPMYEETFRSLLPAAVALGLTTEPRGEAWLRAFADEVADARGHTALWPLLVGSFKRREVRS